MNYTKKAVAIAFLMPLALGLFSCQKCTTCDIVEENGAILYPGNEVCGKKSVVDEHIAAAEATAALYAGASAECTDE